MPQRAVVSHLSTVTPQRLQAPQPQDTLVHWVVGPPVATRVAHPPPVIDDKHPPTAAPMFSK